tara:strand:+ start:809 stop:1087 length:279 start_codon:yes stop_codon:yes gene_type:complete
MNLSKLKELCEIIEKMNQTEQIEILKIIKQSSENINITENNNGCFINMNTVDDKTIEHISKYVDFFKEKEKELNEQEQEKITLLDTLNELNK